MALRKTRKSCHQMGVENPTNLKKLRQSSAIALSSQRKALNEIGNVLEHYSATTSIGVELSQGDPSPSQKLQLRRSTRLSSVSQPQISCHLWKPLCAAVIQKEAHNMEKAARRKTQFGVAPQQPAPTSDISKHLLGMTRRRRSPEAVVKRAPRLTMKPPPVETPLKERLAVQKLLRESLAADQSRQLPLVSTEPAAEAVAASANETGVRLTDPGISEKYDIDLLHRRCFLMVPTYSKGIYYYLQKMDRKISKKLRRKQLKSVSGTTRVKMVSWMASAYLHLRLLQETFQLSVSILDRYLLNVMEIEETKVELVALACLSVGIKYEELLTSLVKELLSLASCSYTLEEFFQMEVEVIRVLDYQVARPIPLVFLRRYNVAARSDRLQHSYGKYLIDLAQLDFELCRLPASSLASAAVFIGINLTNLQVDPDVWNPVMVHYTALTFNDIQSVVSRMASLALRGPQYRPLGQKYFAEASFMSTDRAQRVLTSLHQLSNT